MQQRGFFNAHDFRLRQAHFRRNAGGIIGDLVAVQKKFNTFEFDELQKMGGYMGGFN